MRQTQPFEQLSFALTAVNLFKILTDLRAKLNFHKSCVCHRYFEYALRSCRTKVRHNHTTVVKELCLKTSKRPLLREGEVIQGVKMDQNRAIIGKETL